MHNLIDPSFFGSKNTAEDTYQLDICTTQRQ